jgi:hypothetical protein
MVQLATASTEFFRYQHYHPRESEDPQALWGAAWKAGARAAMHDSARVVELVPLLQNLLFLFTDGAVENDVRASDRRPPYVEDDDECAVTW